MGQPLIKKKLLLDSRGRVTSLFLAIGRILLETRFYHVIFLKTTFCLSLPNNSILIPFPLDKQNMLASPASFFMSKQNEFEYFENFALFSLPKKHTEFQYQLFKQFFPFYV